MQPYFFPYLGYFQLMNAVDEFVIYDNIQYTKKGWINRNRVLSNGQDKMISLPLKKASDYSEVVARSLSDTWPKDKHKIINLIKSCYTKAPYFKQVFPVIEESLLHEDVNLFNFLFASIKKLNQYLNIETKIIISSSLDVDHALKRQDKVISICQNLNAQTYINPIGGLDLYNKEDFNNKGINLSFIKSDSIFYKQFKNDFIPSLSIIDVLMFNSKEQVKKYLQNYALIN